MSLGLLRWSQIAVVSLSLMLPASVLAADHATAAHGDSATTADHHPTGLPMSWTRDLALFSLVTFVVYLTVLRVGAWEPLRAGLTERERRIRQDISDADSNRQKSEQLLKDYESRLVKAQEEVREIMVEARRDADRLKVEIATSAQKEADAIKQRAIAEIQRSKDQALTELFEFVSTNVVNATIQVIGRTLTDNDHERLVKESLSQLNVRRN
jgi:F-type H+-transporting ATPase subunit b